MEPKGKLETANWTERVLESRDVLARLEKLGPAVAVHRLRSDADVRRFLAGV